MTLFKAIILGIIQGLTEFLPVSSSGHLAITQSLLNINENNVLFFTTMLHFGTLISIFLVYSKDIIVLIKEFFKIIFEILTGKGIRINNNDRKLGLLIITATIPTAFIGLIFSDFFESLFVTPIAVGIGLLITGTLLWISKILSKSTKGVHNMRYSNAVIVGLFQSFAIAPGISRSGSTIVGSLLTGLNKELAVKFSFLISIPAILGAAVFELSGAFDQGLVEISLFALLAGILAAAISGFIAIKTMIDFVAKNKIHYFSYYTWILGIIVIVINL